MQCRCAQRPDKEVCHASVTPSPWLCFHHASSLPSICSVIFLFFSSLCPPGTAVFPSHLFSTASVHVFLLDSVSLCIFSASSKNLPVLPYLNCFHVQALCTSTDGKTQPQQSQGSLSNTEMMNSHLLDIKQGFINKTSPSNSFLILLLPSFRTTAKMEK